MEKQTEISSVSLSSGFYPRAGVTESFLSAQMMANDETKSINSFDKAQAEEITQFAQKFTYASRAASLKSKPSKPTISGYPSVLSFGSFGNIADTILKTTVNADGTDREKLDNTAAAAKEPVTFHDHMDTTNPQLNPFSDPSRSAGISFENLGAYGYSRGSDYQPNVLNTVMKLKSIFSNNKGGRVEILRNFNGVVKKGETCVVLGRPGR